MSVLRKDCCGCSACYSICPKGCIEMNMNAEGFFRPYIDATKCTNCKVCEKVCPLNCITPTSTPNAYAVISNDKNSRLSSSSGGVFSLLAQSIIEKGGIVFGAAFDDNFNVVHKVAQNVEEIAIFRGSKYVQSNIGNCYKQAKYFLDNNRWVYFSGTPCQIAGLKSYLGSDYVKLITQDVICHSVPSPIVWAEYKKFRENEAGAKTVNASFRYKEAGIPGYKIRLVFENGKIHSCDGNDPYFLAFINGLSSQESCFDCKFKGLSRASDITLADYWGIETQHPELDYIDGASLVFIHSDKGNELFEKIKSFITYKKTAPLDSVKKNQMAIKSAIPHPRRKAFFKAIKKQGFIAAFNKATKSSTTTRIKNKLRRAIRFIK